jgi:hypothetical protein
MRVILHIGPQKTGTSYMQKRLFQYKTRLDRHKIVYHMPPPDGAARPEQAPATVQPAPPAPPKRNAVHARPAPLEVEVIRNLYRVAQAQKLTLVPRTKHRILERLREADMQPFRALAGDAMLSVPVDDNDDLFEGSRAAMQQWSDRLATRDLAPHFMLPQLKSLQVLPPDALAGAAAQDAFAALLAAGEAPAEPEQTPSRRPQGRFSDLGMLLSQGGIHRFASELAELRAQKVKSLIVSAEQLANLRADQIAPLRELFAGDDVHVYIYCRRWSDRLPSAWWQRVSTGFAQPFPDWLNDTLQNANRNWVVNESLLWQRWAHLFGRKHIHILSYDVLVRAGADLAEDFLFNRLHFAGQSFNFGAVPAHAAAQVAVAALNG